MSIWSQICPAKYYPKGSGSTDHLVQRPCFDLFTKNR